MQKNLVIIVPIVLIVATILFMHTPKESNSKALELQQKALIVGTNAEFPPFEYLEDDLLVGFEIDVVRRIGERLQRPIIFKNLPFDALIPEIQTGNIHMVAAGMTPTPEREKRVYFTTPILELNPLAIVTLSEEDVNKINSVEDLKNKIVAVNEGYFADKYISSLSDVMVFRIASASIGEGLLSLQSGRAEALVASLTSLKPFLAQNADRVRVSIIEGTDEKIAFAVGHQYPELLELLNGVIADMKQDGLLDILGKKWFGA